MSEFLHMGGYAIYVWSSYGLTTIVLLGLLVLSLRQRKRALAEAAAMEAQRGDEA